MSEKHGGSDCDREMRRERLRQFGQSHRIESEIAKIPVCPEAWARDLQNRSDHFEDVPLQTFLNARSAVFRLPAASRNGGWRTLAGLRIRLPVQVRQHPVTPPRQHQILRSS